MRAHAAYLCVSVYEARCECVRVREHVCMQHEGGESPSACTCQQMGGPRVPDVRCDSAVPLGDPAPELPFSRPPSWAGHCCSGCPLLSSYPVTQPNVQHLWHPWSLWGPQDELLPLCTPPTFWLTSQPLSGPVCSCCTSVSSAGVRVCEARGRGAWEGRWVEIELALSF